MVVSFLTFAGDGLALDNVESAEYQCQQPTGDKARMPVHPVAIRIIWIALRQRQLIAARL
jgi:hypothetical protein